MSRGNHRDFLPEGAVSPPQQVTRISTTPRGTKAVMEDYPYHKPIEMMASLQSSATTYPNNAMAIAPSINPYLASGSAISNPSQMAHPQRVFGNAPQDFFGAPQASIRPIPQIQNVRPVQNLEGLNNVGILNNQWQQVVPQQVEHPLSRVIGDDVGRNDQERIFHEQFYIKDLANVKRKLDESIDDYLNRFWIMKTKCFTQIPEHELVEFAAGGLDYSIRKKLDTQYLRDMNQLAVRVRQIERLKAEKAWLNKYHKKEKEAYFEVDEIDQISDDVDCVEENEINVRELKQKGRLKFADKPKSKRFCILEFDGASSGNPGKSGAGVVLRSGNEVHHIRQGLGTQTNNSAEYQALILGMKEAIDKRFDHIEIRGDSKLVCEQFAGNWKVNNPNLRDLHNEALNLKDKFKSVTIQHVPRGSNREADAQASWGKTLQAGEIEEDYYYNSDDM